MNAGTARETGMAEFAQRDACPFCGKVSSSVLAEVDYHDTVEAALSLPNVCGALFECPGCGVAYCSHVYPMERFEALYAANLATLEHFRASLLRRARHLMLREILRIRHRRLSLSSLLDLACLRALLVPSFTLRARGLRVLDVGCGFGEFSQAFRELGNDVVATEILPSYVELMRGQGFECHLSELESIEFDERRFDLIFMRGVFYRMRDPSRTLERARLLLREGGEIATVDPCPGPEGVEYFLRLHFPQGQFYITDCDRYRRMLETRFGLTMVRERVIYGRPRAHQVGTQSSFGNMVEFAELLLSNALRRNPHVLRYTLRRLE